MLEAKENKENSVIFVIFCLKSSIIFLTLSFQLWIEADLDLNSSVFLRSAEKKGKGRTIIWMGKNMFLALVEKSMILSMWGPNRYKKIIHINTRWQKYAVRTRSNQPIRSLRSQLKKGISSSY